MGYGNVSQAHFIDKLESDSDSDPDELPCRPNMSPGRVEEEAPRSSCSSLKKRAAGVEKKVEEPPLVEGLSLADALAGAHDCAAGGDGEAMPPASPVALNEVVVELPEPPATAASQHPPPSHPVGAFDFYAALSVSSPSESAANIQAVHASAAARLADAVIAASSRLAASASDFLPPHRPQRPPLPR